MEEPSHPSSTDPSTIQLRLPPKAISRLLHTPRLDPSSPALQVHTEDRPGYYTPAFTTAVDGYMASPQYHVAKEANSILREFQVWESTSSFTLVHPRTAAGDHAYRHTLRLRMLREVYRLPREEERVQAAVRAIMEIAKEVLAWYGRITW